MKPLVFVSLARKNESEARQILDRLKEAFVDYWVYYRDIPAGRNWRLAAREALYSASHFMVFLSPEALESINVRIELYLARCYKKKLIPVVLNDCHEQIGLYKETEWLYNHKMIYSSTEIEASISEILNSIYPPAQPLALNTNQIFISYAPNDIDFANKLAFDLRQMGGKVWIDSQSIDVGSHIFEERIDGLMTAHYLVICLSGHSIKDEQVKRDLQLSFSRNIPIVPVITELGSASSIKDLSTAVMIDELVKDLLDINWIRYNTWDVILNQLKEAFALFTPKEHQKKGVFISYRRSDSGATCGRLYDRLSTQFGKSDVYRDVVNIPPGVDFSKYISDTISNCAVILILIGASWASIPNHDGTPRIFEPSDLVRIEIEQGLSTENLLVIPVLVGDITMPTIDVLPPSITGITKLNAYKLRDDPYFHDDVDKLIAYIENSKK